MKVITIGRHADNDVFVDDSCASRHHMQIIQHDDRHYSLADFGSANGTFINGQRISGEVNLNMNDVVRIGNTTIPWRLYFEEEEQEIVLYNNVASHYTGDDVDAISANQTMPMNKERHGFVTFWLWLMIVGNTVGAVVQALIADSAIWAYATEENATLFFYVKHSIVDYYINMSYFMIVLLLVDVVAVILLLKWKKLGYWLFVVSAVVCLAIVISFGVLGGVTDSVMSSIIGSILSPVFLWSILQIKKNGVSCWKQLE